MRIDVWADVVCPYCYLGACELKKALSLFDHSEETEIFWHSFELNPEAGAEPKDLASHLATMHQRSLDEISTQMDEIARRAAEHGIDFNRDALICSSTDAHRLIKFAEEKGRGEQMRSRLFKAFFTDGLALSDTETLLSLADEVGLDSDEVRSVLAGLDYLEQVRSELSYAIEVGIAGVPAFVVNNQYLITGVQEADTFVEALDQIWLESQRPQFIDLGSGSAAGGGCGCGGCGCGAR